MNRVLLGLVLLGVSLPCYVWYSSEALRRGGEAWPQGRAAGPTSPPPTPTPPPYQLLDEVAPPPLGELAGLAADDAGSLMDLRGFRWLLGGEAPAGCAPLVLVLVHTATDHAAHRQLIRDTWGSWSSDLLVRFLVGETADAATQRRLRDESASHGDVVQGSFVDAYRNMTYKHAMALKWFATRCPRATYVLKVDDDVLVNAPELLDFVRRELSPHGARRLLACRVLVGGVVKRSWRSKWRVSFREYAADEYPTYCEGWAVLYSPDVAMGLYRELQREPYFWIDDVLVTGVVAGRLGVRHASWVPLLLQSEEDMRRVLAGEARAAFMLALWYSAGMDMDSERAVWQRVLQEQARRNETTGTTMSTTSTTTTAATPRA